MQRILLIILQLTQLIVFLRAMHIRSCYCVNHQRTTYTRTLACLHLFYVLVIFDHFAVVVRTEAGSVAGVYYITPADRTGGLVVLLQTLVIYHRHITHSQSRLIQ